MPENITQVRIFIAIFKPGEEEPTRFTSAIIWPNEQTPPQHYLEQELDRRFEQLKDAAVDSIYD